MIPQLFMCPVALNVHFNAYSKINDSINDVGNLFSQGNGVPT